MVEPNCPKCESRMVERISLYGKFYGCSQYPRCNGTKNIEKASDAWLKRLGAEIWERVKQRPTAKEIAATKRWKVGLRDMYGMIYGE